jgi:DNA mismatch endonuclease (patch repair protein)
MAQVPVLSSKRRDKLGRGDYLITTPERSRLMSKVRQRGTSLELRIAEVLASLGVKYETNVGSLPGKPDFANRGERWAIYVHGCFWHGHRGCHAGRLPKSNRDFWRPKIEGNRARDIRKSLELEQLGFSVLTIWGCEVKDWAKLLSRLGRFFRSIQSKASKR